MAASRTAWRGAGVAAVDDEAAGAGGADDLVGVDGAAVDLDALAVVEAAPERALGDAELAGDLRVEASQARVLGEGVAEAAAAVRGAEGDDVVRAALDALAGVEAADVDAEGDALDAELHRLAEGVLGAAGGPEAHRLLAALEAEGAQQADDAEEVVGVEVGEEDVVEGEAGAVAHHLALGALAAVEHQQLALALDDERADVAAHGGAGGGGAEEGDAHRDGVELSAVRGALSVVRYPFIRYPLSVYPLSVTVNG